MIIKRLAEGFKTQDWFVVGIEIMIVVVGIFIGLQVDDWNTERENKRLAHKYIVRLHDGISVMIEREQVSVKRRKIEMVLLEEVSDNFHKISENFTMTSPHCRAIAGSHIFADTIDVPTAIKELLFTGRILLIDDDVLRANIINYISSIERYKQLRDDVQGDRNVLGRRYPELLSMAPQPEQISCKFDEMVKSKAFINDFYDNLYRYRAYSRLVILEQQSKREDLHKLIDIELGITHSENL